MGSFKISKAEASDIDEIKRLEVDCGLSPWKLEDYRDELDRPDSVILKAVEPSSRIIGFLVGRAPRTGEAEIYNIGVAPSVRRRGIGGMLLDEFCSICRERDLSIVWLEVRAANRAAISFYLFRGFVERSVRPSFYSNPTEDAVLMSLQLK